MNYSYCVPKDDLITFNWEKEDGSHGEFTIEWVPRGTGEDGEPYYGLYCLTDGMTQNQLRAHLVRMIDSISFSIEEEDAPQHNGSAVGSEPIDLGSNPGGAAKLYPGQWIGIRATNSGIVSSTLTRGAKLWRGQPRIGLAAAVLKTEGPEIRVSGFESLSLRG